MLKNTSLLKLIDKICELEAYEEYLEDKVHFKKNPFTIKTDRNNLYETRKKLKKYRAVLEGSQVE